LQGGVSGVVCSAVDSHTVMTRSAGSSCRSRKRTASAAVDLEALVLEAGCAGRRPVMIGPS
jgi:hypothetical protein